MKNYVEDFTNHIKEALEIGKSADFKTPKKNFKNILICGLGGSGIGGSIVTQVLADELKIPAIVNKDYNVPAFANEDTLVILCSYSGNTEETIQMHEHLKSRGCTFACITSGGKLAEISAQEGYDIIQIPSGMPPRAAFGYSFPQLFFVLQKFGLINSGFEGQFTSAIELLDSTEEDIRKAAHDLAEKLHGKIPIIYIDAGYEGVAVRFRQQINENSKMLCWHHAIPEMNHNELVGWRKKDDQLAVVFFRNEDDFYRTQKRMEINKTIISEYTSNISEVHSKGSNILEKCLYLIHYGDWVSVYLAEIKGIDAVEVDVITKLKGELARI